MPTPHNDVLDLAPSEYGPTAHTTCPPESERSGAWRAHGGSIFDRGMLSENHSLRGSASVPQLPESSHIMDVVKEQEEAESRMEDVVQGTSSTNGSSPMTVQADVKDGRDCPSPFRIPPVRATSSLSSCNYEFSEVRVSQYCNIKPL